MRGRGLKYIKHPGQMLARNNNIWHPCRGAGIVEFN